MGQTKITVTLTKHQASALDRQLDRLFIKRDAFLDHMIKHEVAELAREMDGRRLSQRARQYISRQLKRMGPKTINVVVDKGTAESLNAVVDRSNMVRDAFLNRLILFLRSPHPLLAYLDLPHAVVGSAFEKYVPEAMPTAPLQAMESLYDDPFYYLRLAAEERFGTGLYLLTLPQEYVGFSCFLDDASVPGTEEHAVREKENEQEAEKMQKELDQLENDAFAKTVTAESVEKRSEPNRARPVVRATASRASNRSRTAKKPRRVAQ